jgi:hypothetical protein
MVEENAPTTEEESMVVDYNDVADGTPVLPHTMEVYRRWWYVGPSRKIRWVPVVGGWWYVGPLQVGTHPL